MMDHYLVGNGDACINVHEAMCVAVIDSIDDVVLLQPFAAHLS